MTTVLASNELLSKLGVDTHAAFERAIYQNGPDHVAASSVSPPDFFSASISDIPEVLGDTEDPSVDDEITIGVIDTAAINREIDARRKDIFFHLGISVTEIYNHSKASIVGLCNSKSK
jgi:hypothetical protein